MIYSAAGYLGEAKAKREEGNADRCLFNAVVAVSMARHEADDASMYHAFACIGRMHISRLEHVEATGWYQLALDSALSHDLRQWIAPAHHDLYLCYRERGDEHNAEIHLRAAFEGYGDSPRMDNLLADMSEKDPPPERVHRITTLLHPGYTPSPSDRDRLILLSQLSLAYAKLGWASKLGPTYRLMDTLLSREREAGAVSLCTLAEAALTARCYEMAATVAERARELAEFREEMKVKALAEEVLERATKENDSPVREI